MNKHRPVHLVLDGQTYFRKSEIQQMPDNILGVYMVYQLEKINDEESPIFTYFNYGNIKNGLLECLKNESICAVSPFQSCAYWRNQPESYLKKLIDYYKPKVI